MEKLNLIPLGGLGEVGKNMMVLESEEGLIVIDAGMMFPSEDMPGVDIVLPDYSYVTDNAERVRAVVLTHGHEDHIGALPYLMRHIKAPVYASGLTIALAEQRMCEFEGCNRDFREVSVNERLSFGSIDIDFIQVAHSIPEGFGLAIRTPFGIVVHSGDFKLDEQPIDGKPTDIETFAALGREGVLLLLSDSTNAERRGFTPPERIVGRALREIISTSKGKVLVASFASHIHRIQQVFDIAEELGRKVAVCGRSLENNIEIAVKLGYLKIKCDNRVNPSCICKMPPNEIVILSTGSQGEPLSALTRIAGEAHKHVKIEEGDAVIISARPIPGNEKSVNRVIDALFSIGAQVYYETGSSHAVHVSGHAAKDELEILFRLLKPRYFIPIHGEFRHMMHHARMARELSLEPGLDCEEIIILENGHCVRIDDEGVKKGDIKNVSCVLVDGFGMGNEDDMILRDRRQMASDGVFIIVARIDRANGSLIEEPDIIARGFVFIEEASHMLDDLRIKVIETIEKCMMNEHEDDYLIRRDIKNAISKHLYKQIQRRPMIVPIILEN